MPTTKRPMVREHNMESNEIIDREMNDQEFADYQAELEAKAASIEEATNKAFEKAALLERLGITEDEAKLLLS